MAWLCPASTLIWRFWLTQWPFSIQMLLLGERGASAPCCSLGADAPRSAVTFPTLDSVIRFSQFILNDQKERG